MKKALRIFLVAMLAVALLASAVLVASAAEAKRRVDPTTLAPTSDRVVFIMDAPEGKELEGDGTGTDFENPYIPMDHEKFDPLADYPENYYQTSIYQATEMLGTTGGTVVICGPIRLGADQSHGSHNETRDVFTYNWGTKATIKFTSVYNGVDYRETNGAKLIIETPAELGVRGNSIWENIDIVTDGAKRIMSFGSFPTLMGKGIKCYPEDDMYLESASNYISLSGGHRWAKGENQIPTLTVQSGTYNVVAGGMWGSTPTSEMKDATSYLTFEGTAKVLGEISGTVAQNSQYSGHVNITINGGSFPCDIFGVGKTGLVNEDGTVDIVIRGGDFSECWSINAEVGTSSKNSPQLSTLDFSEFEGSKEQLATIYSVATEFTQVLFPGRITEDDLLALVEKVETQPAQTEAPDTPDAPAQTEAVEDEPSNDDKDEQKVDVGENNDNSMMTVLIIVIIVAVVVIGGVGAAIIVILLKKKK